MSDDIADRLERACPAHPGEYDPLDIERRGRRLRRHRNAATALLAGTLISAVLISVTAIVNNLGPTGDRPTQGQPQSFVPVSRHEGDKTVMPVTFLDGTTAEIVYPSELEIASLGAHPYGSGTLEGPGFDGCCARDFEFAYGDTSALAMAGPSIKEFRGADGRPVRLVSGPPGWPADYLVFQIGPWRLGVWEDGTMTDDQLATWAEQLHGRVSPDGFPVITATGPLRLTEAGEGPGPALGFGDPDTAGQLSLQLRECDVPRTEREGVAGPEHGASLCRPEWSTWVNVSGDDQFVEAVIQGLDIRNVRRPSG